MKKLITALLFFSFCFPIYAQWERPYYDIFAVCLLIKDGNIYAGKNGVSRTTDGGQSWNLFNNGLPNVANRFQVNRMYNFNGIIYAGLDTMGVYILPDGGNTWSQRTTGLPANVTVKSFAGYSTVLFAGTDKGVFKSTNGGGLWNLSGMADTMVVDLIFRDNILFASNYSAGVKVSSDLGQTWKNASNGMTGTKWAFTFTNTPNYLVAGTSDAKIYRTSNNGTNWEQCYSQSPANNAIYSLKYALNRLIAGTAQGIFYSYNQGATWLPMNDGFPPNTEMRSDAIVISTIKVFAAPTNGVYQRPLSQLTSVTSSTAELSNFELKQNYPNPFNPNTVISYRLSVAGDVSLKVYDLAGNEVAALVNEKQNAGSYSVTFDAGKYNLSSGVYFYKLKTENFSDTKSMILVK
ncbi:MAG: T9SS type A sorting domain-containing protein [Bacteroidetes bacterium]|nr:T9SS type A sorting domain-containing protein [Bacteroidota bacterium]